MAKVIFLSLKTLTDHLLRPKNKWNCLALCLHVLMKIIKAEIQNVTRALDPCTIPRWQERQFLENE